MKMDFDAELDKILRKNRQNIDEAKFGKDQEQADILQRQTDFNEFVGSIAKPLFEKVAAGVLESGTEAHVSEEQYEEIDLHPHPDLRLTVSPASRIGSQFLLTRNELGTAYVCKNNSIREAFALSEEDLKSGCLTGWRKRSTNSSSSLPSYLERKH
jgi:hypothetical protein